MLTQETLITMSFDSQKKNLTKQEFELATKEYLKKIFPDATNLELEITQDEVENEDETNGDNAD